jgi:hypothetical protein
LRAWFVGPRGFVLLLSTARATEHGFSPFGRANDENVLPAVPTIHHACPAVALAKEDDRSRQDIPLAWRAAWCQPVGLTTSGQAKKPIETLPQTPSLWRTCWDQYPADPFARQHSMRPAGLTLDSPASPKQGRQHQPRLLRSPLAHAATENPPPTRAKPPKATCKPPTSLLVGRGLRPTSHPHATYMRPSSHLHATPKPPQSHAGANAECRM